MNNIIVQVTKTIAEIKTAKFASLTYLTKSSGELARYTILLGISYHNLVEKSVTELEILIRENVATWTDLEIEAAKAVMASLQKTLAAHTKGEQNEDYTKKGQYIPIGGGANVNTTDFTIQLFGLLESKVTIEEGIHKNVNSAPLTVAKNKIRKLLPISKFREFALDLSQVDKVKVSGETFEFENIFR